MFWDEHYPICLHQVWAKAEREKQVLSEAEAEKVGWGERWDGPLNVCSIEASKASFMKSEIMYLQ